LLPIYTAIRDGERGKQEELFENETEVEKENEKMRV